MKIAIIGTGNLGLSMARGILSTNGATSMVLTKRNLSGLKELEKNGIVTATTDNREAVSQSDILIFAVQPGQFVKILGEIKDLLTEKHVIISTITGFSISRMEEIIGQEHYIVRA